MMSTLFTIYAIITLMAVAWFIFASWIYRTKFKGGMQAYVLVLCFIPIVNLIFALFLILEIGDYIFENKK